EVNRSEPLAAERSPAKPQAAILLLFGAGLGVGARLHDAVEQELERPVRLAAEEHLRPAQHDPPLADRRLGDGDAAVEVLLAPGPAATQRRLAVEPGHALQALSVLALGDLERRAVREH